MKSNEDGWRPSVGCAGAGWEETRNNLKRVKAIDFEGAFERYQRSLVASRLSQLFTSTSMFAYQIFMLIKSS